MHEELLSGFPRSSQVRAIFFSTLVTLLTRYSAVEIVYLDLATLKSRLLLSLNAQDTLHDNGLFQPRLSGDLAAVGVNGEDSIEVIVMNWKTKSFFPLPMPHVRTHYRFIITLITSCTERVRLGDHPRIFHCVFPLRHRTMPVIAS